MFFVPEVFRHVAINAILNLSLSCCVLQGMACVGRTKVCSIVPPNHFGPIPGVPVGSAWKFRVQVCNWRPLDCKTRKTTSTRFSHTKQCARVNQRHFGGKTRQPSSFYYGFQRECRGDGNKLSIGRSLVSQKYNEAFQGFYFFENTRKKLTVKFRAHSRSLLLQTTVKLNFLWHTSF